MTQALEILGRGLGTGSVYALLGLGFVIIYQSSRVISFAQPGFMLAGAVLVSYLAGPLGFYAALVAGSVIAAAGALTVERVAIRPMLGRPAFTIAIITLGVDVVVRVITNAFIGSGLRQVGDPWGLRAVTVAGVDLQYRHIAAVTVTVLVTAALFAFLRYSRMGLAMRATAHDQEAALAQGVSVGAVFAIAWALAGALAAIGGAFAAVGGSIDANLWLIALIALPVIILGGLDSLPGAVAGGLTIGVLQELVATYQHAYPAWLGGNVAVITPFLVMLVVLLVRPFGLLGTGEVRRV